MSHKASNQTSFNETNENRLAIRRKLRRILDELHRKKSTLLDIKSGQRDFESILSLVRDIFHQDYMENVRELNLDAIITKELTMILKLQAQKLSDVSKPYELDTLFTSIRTTTKSNQSQLKWENLGLLVNELWTHSYSLTTLQGPIKQQQKVRAMKRPREKDTDFAAVAKADVLENKIGDDKIDEATNKRVQRLLEYLHDLENSNQSVQNGQNIDLLKLLVDPIDPLQTIENFFDFSFLIKVTIFFSFYCTYQQITFPTNYIGKTSRRTFGQTKFLAYSYCCRCNANPRQ